VETRDESIAALHHRLAALEAAAAELRATLDQVGMPPSGPITTSLPAEPAAEAAADVDTSLTRRRLFRSAAAMAAGAGVAVLATGSPAAAATAGNAVLGQANDANAMTSLIPTGSAEPQGLLVVADTSAKLSQLAAFGSVVGMGGAVTGSALGRYGLYGQSDGPASALFLETPSDDVSLLQGTPSAGFPASTGIPHFVGEMNFLANGSIGTCVEAGSPGVWARVGLNPINPARVLDTRPTGGGAVNVGLTGKQTTTPRTLTVAGSRGIPSGATAVAVNITVANPSTTGYVTIWPGGAGQPATSNVNFGPGQTVANFAIIGLGTGGNLGKLAFAVSGGSADLILDVSGYFV
jgi:hypothetical protein